MEVPICTGTSNRSCNLVMPTFTSSLESRYLSISLAKPSKAILRPHQDPVVFFFFQMTTSFAEAGASVRCCRGTELLPWLLNTQGHTTRFARSLAVHRFFPDFPAIVFCLPRSGLAFPMCRRAGKMLQPLLVACFKTYLKETSRFSGRSNLSTPSISTMIWAQLFK